MDGYFTQLFENMVVLWKGNKMVIQKKPPTLGSSVVPPLFTAPWESWRNSLYFNVLERSLNDSPITGQKCHSCQVNKRRQQLYSKLPKKLAITKPWEALCVDLLGPCTSRPRTRHRLTLCASQWSNRPHNKLVQNCRVAKVTASWAWHSHGYRGAKGQQHWYPPQTTLLWYIISNSRKLNQQNVV